MDSTEDLRKAYIDRLQKLPLQAYIAYCELPENSVYEQKYLSLVTKLLPHRLKYFDRASLHLIFEENSAVSTEKLKSIVDQTYEELRVRNGRHPRIFNCSIGSKSDYPEFSAPDYFLCVWGRYAKMKSKEQKNMQREQILFEKLRDQMVYIVNCDNNLVYSRKRPFLSFNSLKACPES